MSPTRWQSIESAFNHAVDLPPTECHQYLASLDPTLRHEVSQLLKADPAWSENVRDMVLRSCADVGDPLRAQFGPWRVIDKIGQGGMGSVFKVVRGDNSYSQTAALKVLSLTAQTHSAIERFQQERQILAQLEHANIARLIDGGETEDGLPYLVLEYVEGEPIHQYIARHQLSTKARLQLFLQVCAAVEYAHRNLIIHRDLKPSNMLVTANGAVKLLDFGIAKLLDANAGLTETGYRALTPDYASPEQVRGDVISTASDVYSLGVVLYELLTGRKPYVITSGSPQEMDRLICQINPPPPGLSADLDNIVAMAMRKEPARRYASVTQFAEDIRRFLDYRPVLARPDSFLYRTTKFVRRNRLPLAIATIALIAISAAAGSSLYQARLARQRYQDLRQLANTFLFQFHDQISDLPGSIKAREFVVKTALDYLDRLSRNTGGDPVILEELATAYTRVARVQGFPGEANLGQGKEALQSFERAAAIRDQIPRNTAERAIAFMELHTRIARQADDLTLPDRAQAAISKALAAAESYTFPSTSNSETAIARAYMIQGDMYRSQRDATKSLDAYAKAATHFRLMAANDKSRRLPARPRILLLRLGAALADAGRLREALATYEELRPMLANDQRTEISYLTKIADVYQATGSPSFGDSKRSLEYAQRAFALAEKAVQHDPNDRDATYGHHVIQTHIGFVQAEIAPRAAARMLEAADQDMVKLRKADPSNHEYVLRDGQGKALLAIALSRLGPNSAIDPLIRAAVAAEPARTQDRAILLRFSATAFLNQRRYREAESLLTEALAIYEELMKNRPRNLYYDASVGRIYTLLARIAKETGDQPQQNEWRQRECRLFAAYPPSDFTALRLAGCSPANPDSQ